MGNEESIQHKLPSQNELFRKQKLELIKSRRVIDREILNLEKQEKIELLKLEKYARDKKPMHQIKNQARQVATLRNSQTKCGNAKNMINTTIMKLQNVKNNEQMINAIKNIIVSLKKVNNRYSIKNMAQLQREFEKQIGITDLKDDMLNDIFDDIGDEDIEEEEEELITKILDEVGIEVNEQFSKIDIPTNDTELEKQFLNVDNGNDTDLILQKRLEELRKE